MNLELARGCISTPSRWSTTTPAVVCLPSRAESCTVGHELVGVVEVDNWDQVADALAARGHDRGACFHLPELDE